MQASMLLAFYWALEEAKEYIPKPLLYYFNTKSYVISFFHVDILLGESINKVLLIYHEPV